MVFCELFENENDYIKEMSVLASKIVKEYYDPIIGSEQNDYMIQKFQSYESIREQLSKGYRYFFVIDDENCKIGFIAVIQQDKGLYLSKFYLEKAARGKGYARLMMNFVIENARKNHSRSVSLNVNKYNESRFIYEKLGFRQVRKEKIDIGGGYYMDDFVYEYLL